MKISVMISAFVLALMLTGCAAASAETDRASITCGTQTQRGFVNDNIYHSKLGDIHYSSYIPDSYDGREPYALFITLPGWEGLYFHGVGANMVEDFGPEAIGWNEKMIVISPQLNDWRETSARQTIALTECLMDAYNIDPDRVYLEGYSGGGETGSLVMGMRPELYAAFMEAHPDLGPDGRPIKKKKRRIRKESPADTGPAVENPGENAEREENNA